MTEDKIEARIKTPLWVKWYVRSIILFCKIFGTEPDYEKLSDLLYKHLKVKTR